MKRILTTFLMATALTIGTASLSASADEVPHSDEINMKSTPHTELMLDNGLRVFLLPDKTLPLVSVNMWLDVGSKNERKGLTGFAHLFEHLMFMGTEAIPELDVVLENGGASNNASTREDATNYYTYGPSNMLETMLTIDADRLAHLADSMTQEKLDKQREVVLNERRQSYENQPYGKVWLELPTLMYPPGHPYAHPVIGSAEDIRNATVEDVKAFFREFYTPSNATLVIAGDFEIEEVKAMLDRTFAKVPAATKAEKVEIPQLDRMQKNRFETTDDVQMPKILFFYHSPAFTTEGDAEMDILSSILCKGKNSRFIKDLVYDKEIVSSMSCGQYSSGASFFVVEATPSKPEYLERVESEIIAHIEKIVSEGPSEDEFEKTKVAIETSTVRQMQSVSQRADNFNQYHFYTGNTDYPRADLRRYKDANVDSLKKTMHRVFKDENRLIVVVRPKG